MLTVLGTWLILAVLASSFVAALGRSALREDQALGLVPTWRPDARPLATRADRSVQEATARIA